MTLLELNILIAKYGKDNTAVRLCEIYQGWNKLEVLDNGRINESADLFAERVAMN